MRRSKVQVPKSQQFWFILSAITGRPAAQPRLAMAMAMATAIATTELLCKAGNAEACQPIARQVMGLSGDLGYAHASQRQKTLTAVSPDYFIEINVSGAAASSVLRALWSV